LNYSVIGRYEVAYTCVVAANGERCLAPARWNVWFAKVGHVLGFHPYAAMCDGHAIEAILQGVEGWQVKQMTLVADDALPEGDRALTSGEGSTRMPINVAYDPSVDRAPRGALGIPGPTIDPPLHGAYGLEGPRISYRRKDSDDEPE
jgi:hypothetical protein